MISFRRGTAPALTLEEQLAQLAGGFLGGSVVVVGLVVGVSLAIARAINEGIGALADAFLLKVLAIAPLYVLSVVLLGTLRGKHVRRRAASWLYSILFHAGLLLYFGLALGGGSLVLVLCIPEVLTLAASVAGLALLAYKETRRAAA